MVPNEDVSETSLGISSFRKPASSSKKTKSVGNLKIAVKPLEFNLTNTLSGSLLKVCKK